MQILLQLPYSLCSKDNKREALYRFASKLSGEVWGLKTLLNSLEFLFLFFLHSSKIWPGLLKFHPIIAVLVKFIFLLFLEYLNIFFSFHWKRKIMLIKNGSFKWVFVSQLYRVAKSLSLSHIVKQQLKQPLRRRPRKTSPQLLDSVLSYLRGVVSPGRM